MFVSSRSVEATLSLSDSLGLLSQEAFEDSTSAEASSTSQGGAERPFIYGVDNLFENKELRFQQPPQVDLIHRKAHWQFRTFLEKFKAQFSAARQTSPPQAAISYAWAWPDTDPAAYESAVPHYVEAMALDLVAAGVEVLLDRWWDKPGKEIPEFIRQIATAEFKLAVCSHLYREKSGLSLREWGQREPYVKAELRQFHYSVTHSESESDRVIPILLEGEIEDSVPDLLRGKIPVLLTRDYFEGMFRLLSALFSIPYGDAAYRRLTEELLWVVQLIPSPKYTPVSEVERARIMTQQAWERARAEAAAAASQLPPDLVEALNPSGKGAVAVKSSGAVDDDDDDDDDDTVAAQAEATALSSRSMSQGKQVYSASTAAAAALAAGSAGQQKPRLERSQTTGQQLREEAASKSRYVRQVLSKPSQSGPSGHAQVHSASSSARLAIQTQPAPVQPVSKGPLPPQDSSSSSSSSSSSQEAEQPEDGPGADAPKDVATAPRFDWREQLLPARQDGTSRRARPMLGSALPPGQEESNPQGEAITEPGASGKRKRTGRAPPSHVQLVSSTILDAAEAATQVSEGSRPSHEAGSARDEISRADAPASTTAQQAAPVLAWTGVRQGTSSRTVPPGRSLDPVRQHYQRRHDALSASSSSSTGQDDSQVEAAHVEVDSRIGSEPSETTAAEQAEGGQDPGSVPSAAKRKKTETGSERSVRLQASRTQTEGTDRAPTRDASQAGRTGLNITDQQFFFLPGTGGPAARRSAPALQFSGSASAVTMAQLGKETGPADSSSSSSSSSSVPLEEVLLPTDVVVSPISQVVFESVPGWQGRPTFSFVQYKVHGLFRQTLTDLSQVLGGGGASGTRPTCYISWLWNHTQSDVWASEAEIRRYIDQVAADLQLAGVSVLTDWMVVRPGHSMDSYLEAMRGASVILMVCTEDYRDSYNGIVAVDSGDSVTGRALQGVHRLTQDGQRTVISAMFGGDAETCVPVPHRNKRQVDFEQDYYQAMFSLLRVMHGIPNADRAFSALVQGFVDRVKALPGTVTTAETRPWEKEKASLWKEAHTRAEHTAQEMPPEEVITGLGTVAEETEREEASSSSSSAAAARGGR